MKTLRTNRMSPGRLLPIFLTLLTLPLRSPARAQSGDENALPLHQEVAEQEGAVYGRLRFFEGTITLRRDNDLMNDLVINDPLAPGDVFTTADDGRAEIQLADGSSVKLDYDTELVMQSLSDSSNQIENTTILQLGAGSIIVRADNMDSKEKRFQIDTDIASIFLLSDGLFRIDVRPDGTAVVSSRRGVAEVMAEDVSSLVRSGERITARSEQIPGEARVFNTRLSDEFDVWAAQRDEALVRRGRVDETAPAGLPEPVEPYSDELSYYGHWYNNPSYGWIWRPVGLGPDWQPYLYGRWADCPTGIAWVSYEPWGWAPFHYGRWEFLLGTGWVWIPGHVFSGAYVAWSVSPGYLGWCPLGYYDYPVSFNVSIGFHRDPWIYVNAQNLYARRVNTVVIRDVTVVHQIERDRVVVRGRPVIDPHRVKDAPRLATELHNVALDHPNLRLDPASGGRRLPFRENERQQLVRLNNKHLREGGVSRGTPVVRGGAGRPVSVMPTDRRVNVPPARATQNGGNPGRGWQARTQERSSTPGESGQSVGPRKDQQPRGDSLPERVIPRIIPRSGVSGESDRRPAQAQPRGPLRKVEPREDGPSAPPQRPTAQPGPERPKGGQSAGPQQARPERPKQNSGNSGGGNKGNGDGGKKHKD